MQALATLEPQEAYLSQSSGVSFLDKDTLLVLWPDMMEIVSLACDGQDHSAAKSLYCLTSSLTLHFPARDGYERRFSLANTTATEPAPLALDTFSDDSVNLFETVAGTTYRSPPANRLLAIDRPQLRALANAQAVQAPGRARAMWWREWGTKVNVRRAKTGDVGVEHVKAFRHRAMSLKDNRIRVWDTSRYSQSLLARARAFSRGVLRVIEGNESDIAEETTDHINAGSAPFKRSHAAVSREICSFGRMEDVDFVFNDRFIVQYTRAPQKESNLSVIKVFSIGNLQSQE